MFRRVFRELKAHAPFTFMGAILGIFTVFLLKKLPEHVNFNLFYIFHPAHVLLSAFVTTSMYKLNKKKPHFLMILIVGLLGSIGVATLSDSIFPYIGESILHFPHRELHLGFIERWYIVDPIALMGILLAVKKPFTKFPHSGHIFVSTAASLLHIVMSLSGVLMGFGLYVEITFLLFFSVWIPCCFSDIVFPLLFVGKSANVSCCCCGHNHNENYEGNEQHVNIN